MKLVRSVLGLDSSRIQLNTLGHTPTPSVAIKSCNLCLLPFFVDCTPPVRSWSTWSSLISWYLSVHCLLWYALVVHTENMSVTVDSFVLFQFQGARTSKYCFRLFQCFASVLFHYVRRPLDWIGLCGVLRPRQHSIGYMGDGFYRSKYPTNNIKVLKENLQRKNQTTQRTDGL